MKAWAWLCLFAVLFLAVAGILPFHDDWTYATAPNLRFGWRDLLPGGTFWRPFDSLWGALLAQAPGAFPLANRALIVAGHVVNVALVGRILGCRLGAVFFAGSSAIAATLVNTDTINQVWSFALGAAAVVCARRPSEGASGWRTVLVAGLLMASLLAKESGMSWIAALPLLVWWQTRSVRRATGWLAVGVAVALVYFGLRFGLQGEVALGDGRDYALGVTPGGLAANLAIGAALPVSGLDALAWVVGKRAVFGASAVLSLAFWLAVAGTAVRRSGRAAVAEAGVGAILVTALALPHCLMTAHHPAEIHFYPVVFGGAFLVGLAGRAGLSRRGKVVLAGLMAALFAVGWADKLGEAHRRSAETRRRFREIAARGFDYSKPVYFVVDEDASRVGYSVFRQSVAHGLDYGLACRALNGWRDIDRRWMTPANEAEIPSGAQKVRLR